MKKYKKLICGLMIVFVICIYSLFIFEKVWAIKSDLAELERNLNSLSFSQVQNSLNNITKNLSFLKSNTKFLRKFKNENIQASLDLLESVSISLKALNRGLADINEVFFDVELSQDKLPLLLEKIEKRSNVFREVLSQLDEAEKTALKIPDENLSSQVLTWRSLYLEKFKKAKNVFLILDVLPRLLGQPEPKTYLILIQNSRELRPTGGFWGNYGILKLNQGKIEEFWLDDIYHLDENSNIKIEKPWPLMQLLDPLRPCLFLRDVNFDPYFPNSATRAEKFYHLEGGEEKLDGVIAINSLILKDLLKLLGPIYLESWDITLDSSNVLDELECFTIKKYVAYNLPGIERKAMVRDFSKKLKEKLLSLPQEKALDFLKILKKNLEQKEILIYAHDKKIQDVISSLNFGGEIKEAEGDFLFVVDSNMSSTKTDKEIERSIFYSLTIDDQNEAHARVVLTYKNKASGKSLTTREYRNWCRIYVPQGSKLISVSGNQTLPDLFKDRPYWVSESCDLKKTIFGALVIVRPQETKTLIFEYKLPKYIFKDKMYGFFVQKQSGTSPDIELTFSFPKNIKWIFSGLTEKLEHDKNILKLRGKLDIDSELKVTFR